MALGASFLAANRSKAFNVRKVGMVDKFPFAIGVRLAELPGAEVEVPVGEDGKPGKGEPTAVPLCGLPSGGTVPCVSDARTCDARTVPTQPGTSARSCLRSTTGCRA